MEYDIIGIGTGPANLSLAALLASARERGRLSIRSTFLERNPKILWHAGQLLPGTLMQTEFYRDLVTPADPTCRFSFLNYLKCNGRLDQFFCSSTIYPTRREFEDYFNWVAQQIADVVFGANVTAVDYDPERNLFRAETDAGRRESKHIVLGCGRRPSADIAKGASDRIVDVSEVLAFNFPSPLRRILLVGGGQSAAECLNYLLDRYAAAPLDISWVTRETTFGTLDIGNFVRETYSASYPQAFAALPASLRQNINRDNKNVAYGITPALAQPLYQRLYGLKYLIPAGAPAPSVRLQANCDVIKAEDAGGGASVMVSAASTGETTEEIYDCVILCSGFDDSSTLTSPLIGDQLKRRIGEPRANPDFTIAWDGPRDRMIFVQSENHETHGIGDANFITAPGRNAAIINLIAGREIYKIDKNDALVAL